MPKFDEVLAKRPPLIRVLAEDRLLLLSDHRGTTFQAYGNLKTESRLPEATWDEMIDALLTAPATPSALQAAIRGVARRSLLLGQEVIHPKALRLGRAVTLDSFASLTRKIMKGRPRHRVLQEVRDFYSKPLEIVQRRWQSRDLGAHLMWSTFDLRGRNPFKRFPGSADGIRRVLGLDPLFRGRPLLLIEFQLPPGNKPQFPTIADAYAGDEWSYFFRPAPENAQHGMTMCWPEFAKKTRPRPEVVHSVINGSHLSSAPQRLK